jgi:hypothetical protein
MVGIGERARRMPLPRRPRELIEPALATPADRPGVSSGLDLGDGAQKGITVDA